MDIALLSGYRSQQAFTSAFTAMYKMPPNMYRENERFYPLQLRFDFERSYEMLDRTESAGWKITFATEAEIPMLDGAGEACDRRIPVPGRGGIYPGFEAENKDKTGADSKDRGLAAGILLFTYENGSIDFMGSHPLYRKRGVPKALLDKVMGELLRGRKVKYYHLPGR